MILYTKSRFPPRRMPASCSLTKALSTEQPLGTQPRAAALHAPNSAAALRSLLNHGAFENGALMFGISGNNILDKPNSPRYSG